MFISESLERGQRAMFYYRFDLLHFDTCKTVMEWKKHRAKMKVLSFGQKNLLVVVGNWCYIWSSTCMVQLSIFNSILEMQSFSIDTFWFSQNSGVLVRVST